MLFVYIEAPFAAFRTFTAGWYRPSAGFITPSAAYGLLLNIAGIDSRLREEDENHDGKSPCSLTREGLPSVEIAVGIPWDANLPGIQMMYQQLHNYPVGASGKERAASCFSNKYNITPVRREYLSDLKAVIAVKTDTDTELLIRQGLGDNPPSGRYGVPFLGDNSFLLDRCQIVDQRPVKWYEKIDSSSEEGIREHSTRLTIQIDRADLSKTSTGLFSPGIESINPPPSSWVKIESIKKDPPTKPKSIKSRKE